MSAPNGFGRRGLTPPTERAAPVARAAAPMRILQVARSRLGRQIGGIALGVALLLAVKGMYAVAFLAAGKGLALHWQENVGYPPLERALERTGEADASLKRAHAACEAQSKTAGLAKAQSDALDMHMAIYAGEVALARAAAYLDCLTGERPARFCAANHREHLRLAVADYFSLQGKVRGAWEDATHATRAEFRAFTGDPLGQAARAGIAFPSQRTDPRLIASLIGLIENGYLVQKDLGQVLGFALPGDLATALRDVARKREGCA
jgi:hypothetical protein